MQNLPEFIPVDEIIKTSPEYDLNKIGLYEAVFLGGELFRSKIDQLLDKREVELIKPKIYELRKASSRYLNKSNGLINLFKSSVFKKPPVITTEPESEYWTGLSRNADGNGTPLATLAREALLGMLVNNRSYLMADFREEISDSMEPDSNAAKMRVLTADMIDNWGRDEFGSLQWSGCIQ